MNIERLELLAATIETSAVPDVSLNMDFWYSDHACGTVACIGGYADLLFGEGVPPDSRSISDTQRDLDLTNEQAEKLFFGYWAADEVTPEGAARVIRHLTETGEVDWTILNKEVHS